MSQMKWWGWGDEGVAFTHEDKPELGPFIRAQHRRRRRRARRARRSAFDELDVPEPLLDADLRAALEAAVGAEHVSTDAARPRRPRARQEPARPRPPPRAATSAACPTSSSARAARRRSRRSCARPSTPTPSLIPFGGGTNISGSLEAPRRRGRARSSRSTWRGMDRVLEIDDASRLARVQAGVVRPGARGAAQRPRLDDRPLPRQLHATRRSAAGSRPARRACSPTSTATSPTSRARVRVVTPAGMLVTRPVPTTSTGPSVREMVLGSEGRLGIITRGDGARAPRCPSERMILGYLFPDWARARSRRCAAIAESDAAPSVTRVSDAPETRVLVRDPQGADARSTALKSTGAARRSSSAQASFDARARCASRSSATRAPRRTSRAAQARRQDRRRRTAACASASSPGELYDQKKFDTPYIRDFLLDRGALADVSETVGAVERAAGPLRQRDGGGRAARSPSSACAATSCATCRTRYHAGACLYFTFAFKPSGRRRRARPVRPRQARDPAGVHRLRRRRCRTTTRSAPSTRAGSRRTSRRRASRCCARCSTASTRART